jgi:hypothetical protein
MKYDDPLEVSDVTNRSFLFGSVSEGRDDILYVALSAEASSSLERFLHIDVSVLITNAALNFLGVLS